MEIINGRSTMTHTWLAITPITITVQGDFSESAGVTAADFGQNVTLVMVGAESAPGNTFSVINGALFNANLSITGDIYFTSGLTTFSSVTFSPGSYVTFANSQTYDLADVDWQGTSAAPITLRSDTSGTQWLLIAGYPVVSYVDVEDSNANGGPVVTALNSTNSSNNFNWIFNETAQVAISTPASSITSPAWVEGTSGDDVTGLSCTVNGGAAFNATQLNPQDWYADNTGTPLGITLSPTAATNVSVTATDGPFTNTASQDITWTATDLAGQNSSSDTVTIRMGDSLLLTASGSGTVLTIDPDGNGVQFTDALGNNFPYQYSTAGTYTAQAWIDGNSMGTLTVVVVSLVELKPVDIQVGYTRVQAVADSEYRTISPIGEVSDIYFTSNNQFLLTVTETVVSETSSLNMTPLTQPGNMFMLARLGSATGPSLSVIAVNEFTLDDTAAQGVWINPNTGAGTATFTMHPFLPGMIFDFDMFAHTSTFLNGATSFTVNTSDTESSLGEPGFQQLYNSTTGEMDGVFTYTVDMPPDETIYCISEQPFQDPPPVDETSGLLTGYNGNKKTTIVAIKTLIGNNSSNSSTSDEVNNPAGPGHTALVRDAAGMAADGSLPDSTGGVGSFPSGLVVNSFEGNGWNYYDYDKYIAANKNRPIFESDVTSEVDPGKVDDSLKSHAGDNYVGTMTLNGTLETNTQNICSEEVKNILIDGGAPASTAISPTGVENWGETVSGQPPVPADNAAVQYQNSHP
jgi:hypothetical protein